MDILNSFISAIIGLFIGTLLGNEITRYLYRPKVILKFKKMIPLHSKDGFFISIQVGNVGRTVASNCIGIISLTDLNKDHILNSNDAVINEGLPSYRNENLSFEFPREQLIGHGKFREINSCELCWSKLGNPDEININPGSIQSLDVFRVQFDIENQYWYIILPSEKGWRKIRIRLKLVTKITGRISVCPSNEFPTHFDFRLFLNSKGFPTFEPIKYNFLQKIRNKFREF